jgi:hypothetical protein
MKRVKTALLFNDKYKQGYSYIMPTPTQAQLALERDAILAAIADQRALYNSLVAKGQINSAQEVLVSIASSESSLSTLTGQINNYTQFSAERTAQDAEIASTQNFEFTNSSTNQVISRSSTTATNSADVSSFYRTTSSSFSTETTTSVTNTTGGGSVTTVSLPPIETPQSLALKQQADAAQREVDLLSLNPTTPFGQRALDRKLAEGTITQDQYNYVTKLTDEERQTARIDATNKTLSLSSQSIDAQVQLPPTVTTTPNYDTTEVTVTNINLKTDSSETTLNGAVSGYGSITVEVVDGVEYQVTKDSNGAATSYTGPDGITINLSEPVYSTSTTAEATQPVGIDTTIVGPVVTTPVSTSSLLPGLVSSLAIANLINKPTFTNLLIAAFSTPVTNFLSNLFSPTATPTTPAQPPNATVNTALSQTAEQYAAEQQQQYANLAIQSQTAEEYAAQEAAGYEKLAIMSQTAEEYAAQEAAGYQKIEDQRVADSIAAEEADAAYQLAMSQTAEDYAAQQASFYPVENVIVAPKAGEPGGPPLLSDAEIAKIYGVTDPQEVGAITGTTIITDEARAALSDPAAIAAQEAQNQAIAENPIKEVTVTTVPLSDLEAAALLDQAEANADASSTPETVPNSPSSAPYDELGNLNPGWGLDETNNPVWVAEGYIEPTQDIPDSQKEVPNGPTSDPYDETGQLNPGWGLDENNNPVWVEAGYIEQTQVTPDEQKEVPNGPTSDPYDETGQLNPGWGLDENNNPVWVKEGYIDATGENISDQQTVPNGPTSDPYDELGNLNPGWGLDENNNPVWVAEGYIDATGENISDQQTVPNGPTSDPYDELGNLNPGWGLDENNNPVWVGEGYIDATGENISDQKTVPDGPTSDPYDELGNLNPGWNVDELGTPYWVGGDFIAPSPKESSDASTNVSKGITSAESKAQGSATKEAAVSFEKAKDWRVRLSLAPSAKYLYNADNPGILQPLAATKGVIFPYTPAVSVVYAANYDPTELVHSNYKIYNYKNSSVDTVSITCDFTAQDTTEASYLLAVIHFFKSVTKMFYGRDENPRNGTPPPLCYMSGLGTFQFDNHPLVITNFTYTLPNDVDYIRAGSQTNEPGNSTARQTTPVNKDSASASRMQSSGLGAKVPNFQRQAETINSNATYVPTKMQIAITCIPIVTRNDISNRFSLKDYATGKLMQGSKNNGGGIW